MVECPCNICEKADECPNTYICPELKTWVIDRKRKNPDKDKKDVFITNDKSGKDLLPTNGIIIKHDGRIEER